MSLAAEELKPTKTLKITESQHAPFKKGKYILSFKANIHKREHVNEFPYNPITLGEFSLSADRSFSNGASIPHIKGQPKLPIDLNDGFKDWEDLSEIPTLDVLFKWICHNNFATDNINLITYRGLLKKIAMTKFDTYKNHWCVRLSKLHSTVIMDEIETDENKKKRQSETMQQKKFQFYGHKFEDEILKFEGDKKESNIVVTSKIGPYRCLFAAEVDGKDEAGNIVEIKTHRQMFTDYHKQAFERSKLLNTYMQCYIAGMNHTCFGFRDQKGYVKHIENYSLDEIEKRCNKKWKKDAVMNSLKDILNWALSQIEPEKVYHLMYCGDDHIELIQINRIKYLPDWFIDHVAGCHKNSD